jgi:MoxR-like ATPase
MLLGEAGIGKTSLLAAVQETVRDLPIVRAQAYAKEN